MSAAVATAPALRKRSGVIAALLASMLSPVAFAYVQRPGWGITFLFLGPVFVLVAGRLGLPFTAYGYYVLIGIALACVVAAMVFAFRFARTLPAQPGRRWYNHWYHYLWIAALTMGANHAMQADRGRLFGFEPYRMPAESMQPALMPGDFIVADFRGSSLAQIEVGDIVVFEPEHHPEQRWVKRVVGVPGQAIEVRGNDVFVDGKREAGSWRTIREPALPVQPPFGKVSLKADEFFLMGDNRPNSEDSRFTGPVKRAAIVGKARLIWLHYGPDTGRIDTSRIGPIDAATSGS